MAAGHFDSSTAAAGKDHGPNLQLVDTLQKVGERPFTGGPKVAQNDVAGKDIDFNKHRMEEIDGKKWLHDPTELANLMSDGFRNTGKLDLADRYMMLEAMRANYKDLPGWASKFNDALKGTGTSIKMGDGVAEAVAGGNEFVYTAHIMRGNKETDSTHISF
jgi:hypothetical protein